jgi:hypothetical protein
MVWSRTTTVRCPGCGRHLTTSRCAATCPVDGWYYVNFDELRGWYRSEDAFGQGRPSQASRRPTSGRPAGWREVH